MNLALHDRLGDLQKNFVDGREMIDLATRVLKSQVQSRSTQHIPADAQQSSDIGIVTFSRFVLLVLLIPFTNRDMRRPNFTCKTEHSYDIVEFLEKRTSVCVGDTVNKLQAGRRHICYISIRQVALLACYRFEGLQLINFRSKK